MGAQPKNSGTEDKVSSEIPAAHRELYRELCEDDDGNRYTVIVFQLYPNLTVTDYARLKTARRCA
ncbi:hypothetical protein [Bosea sp. CS1GBMeth4]|uniref:hypothetical protein n=1 Tax=Bosea sp. CS1GBMeth4 TaxID=1892849 RepID=UPI0016495DF9|nr:hypothetical protein [Bosea sp. CS1GBMeth4]